VSGGYESPVKSVSGRAAEVLWWPFLFTVSCCRTATGST